MKIAIRASFALLIFLEALGPFLLPEQASDFTWLGLAVTAAFAWAIIEVFKLSPLTALAVLGAILIDGASALFELYSRIEPWDLWIHALGGAVIALGSVELIRRALKNNHVIVRAPEFFLAAGVYLLTATIGFMYELWEYLVDKLQYGYPKSLVSAYDSIEDQVMNLLGATVVLGIYHLWMRRVKRKASR